MTVEYFAFRSRLLLASAVLASLALFPAPRPAAAQEDGIVSEVSAYASDEASPSFEEPALLIEAFKGTLEANDIASLAELLGLNAQTLMSDENTLDNFVKIRDGVAKKLVLDESPRRIMLEIGDELWPFPFPIVRDDDGKWSFDTMAGLEEIVNRRIGENELQAIATARGYVDAQREYAQVDHDGDGVLEYSQKLISSDGQTDGLYWPYTPEAGESPAGNFVDKAELDDTRRGYFGYRFRILTGQGDNIAGGAYDYVINGNMIAGFALIAWPVNYAITGVKTFVVNQAGTVYEKDLGEATAQIVPYIDSFNPGEDWELTTD